MKDLTFTKNEFGKYVASFQLTKTIAQIHLEFADAVDKAVILGQTVTGTNPIHFDTTHAGKIYDKIVNGGVVGAFIVVEAEANPSLAKYIE